MNNLKHTASVLLTFNDIKHHTIRQLSILKQRKMCRFLNRKVGCHSNSRPLKRSQIVPEFPTHAMETRQKKQFKVLKSQFFNQPKALFLESKKKHINPNDPAAFARSHNEKYMQMPANFSVSKAHEFCFNKDVLNQESTYYMLFYLIERQLISLDLFINAQFALQVHQQFSSDYQGATPLTNYASQIEPLDVSNPMVMKDLTVKYREFPFSKIYPPCVIDDAFTQIIQNDELRYPFWHITIDKEHHDKITQLITGQKGYLHVSSFVDLDTGEFKDPEIKKILSEIVGPLQISLTGYYFSETFDEIIFPSYAFAMAIATHFQRYCHQSNTEQKQIPYDLTWVVKGKKDCQKIAEDASFKCRPFYQILRWETVRDLRLHGINPVSIYHPDIKSMVHPHEFIGGAAMNIPHDLQHFIYITKLGSRYAKIFLEQDTKIPYGFIQELHQANDEKLKNTEELFCHFVANYFFNPHIHGEYKKFLLCKTIWKDHIRDCLKAYCDRENRPLTDLAIDLSSLDDEDEIFIEAATNLPEAYHNFRDSNNQYCTLIAMHILHSLLTLFALHEHNHFENTPLIREHIFALVDEYIEESMPDEDVPSSQEK